VQAGVADQSRACFRHRDGAIPVRSANTRPKCELSLKPHANAMSVMERSAASGAAHALLPEPSHHGLAAFSEDFLQEAQGDPEPMRDLAGGKTGIVKPQRDETSGASVEVGTSRRAQTA